MQGLKTGKAFPTFESAYQRAIGGSDGRQLLLHLLAEQATEASFTDVIGPVVLKNSRTVAEELGVQFVDQVMPGSVEATYGPVLERVEQGVYEFVNPVLRPSWHGLKPFRSPAAGLSPHEWPFRVEP